MGWHRGSLLQLQEHDGDRDGDRSDYNRRALIDCHG
jgi:hypothetical protein